MAGPLNMPETPRALLRLSDAELLAQCEMDTYRASGPGGQKRNKTSSAVRLRHQPTGLIVTAVESRSQHENRERAIRRLRQAIALTQRNTIESQAAHPEFFTAALLRDASLHVNEKHSDYYLIVQHILDVLASSGVSVSDAAERLGISTGQLIRFLKDDPKLWEQANQMRRKEKLSALR
jgi:hypothetical protein